MPRFQCSVCSTDFEVPQPSLDRFPGWKPKFCRKHSPSKKSKPSGAKKSSPRKGASDRDERLTCAEVLAKYTEGPTEGVFTDGSSIPNPGPGGWGVVWVCEGEIADQAHGSEAPTNLAKSFQSTSMRLELK